MVQVATGASVSVWNPLFDRKRVLVTEWGVACNNTAIENTRAMNEVIRTVSEDGGGTVIVPAGNYRIFTIEMKSYVKLQLEKNAVLQAEASEVTAYGKKKGVRGNYKEPEVERYMGLQDHGHSYLANSLVYADHAHDFMICGEGMFFGGETDPETGELHYLLDGDDPKEPVKRDQPGHQGVWFGNKGIALKHCERVVLQGFTFLIGGHFAIITEGVEELLIENVLVDTTRDALDLDACRHVTVRNSVFNSLTDDAIVIKSSFGAGTFFRTEDILIEDCTVSGYDAGSVVEKTYETEKMVAADRCGPTGRVKLGTESTCGYDRVTIRRVHFDRSRGFAIEAVDGSDATNILFEDCFMEHISSSPIFLKAGDRGRFPVTGVQKEENVFKNGEVRVEQVNWVLPDSDAYEKYPVRRYAPSYRRDQRVTVDGEAYLDIVNEEQPLVINETNIRREDGRILIGDKEVKESEIGLYANAYGSERPAQIAHVCIRNVEAVDVDPRYPILIMGMMDGKCKDITLQNIQVTYRGGLSMEHATEQRQLNTWWKYEQFHAEPRVQNLPWLVNTFFLKNEGLLPRFDFNPMKGVFVADPYNVPELSEVYPEPSNWGILPAYGLYARHCEEMKLENISLNTEIPDTRDGIVLDDVTGIEMSQITMVGKMALVTNLYKRPTHFEYCKEYPYQKTTVSGLVIDEEGRQMLKEVVVEAPAPGTPKDSLYPYPTAATRENGFTFEIETKDYPIPETVYRPFIKKYKPLMLSPGETRELTIVYRAPACEVLSDEELETLFEENRYQNNPVVHGKQKKIVLTLEKAPLGVKLDGDRLWVKQNQNMGETEEIVLSIDDGIRKEYQTIQIIRK